MKPNRLLWLAGILRINVSSLSDGKIDQQCAIRSSVEKGTLQSSLLGIACPQTILVPDAVGLICLSMWHLHMENPSNESDTPWWNCYATSFLWPLSPLLELTLTSLPHEVGAIQQRVLHADQSLSWGKKRGKCYEFCCHLVSPTHKQPPQPFE